MKSAVSSCVWNACTCGRSPITSATFRSRRSAMTSGANQLGWRNSTQWRRPGGNSSSAAARRSSSRRHRRRELPQQRAELRRGGERGDPLEEERQVRLDLPQALDVRDVPAHLHREEERRAATPRPSARPGPGCGQPVEGHVDLDRVEVPRVEAEPVPRGAAAAGRRRRAASAGSSSPSSRRGSRAARSRAGGTASSVPAATTRERDSRSSGARPNGGAVRQLDREAALADEELRGRDVDRARDGSQRDDARRCGPAARWQ